MTDTTTIACSDLSGLIKDAIEESSCCTTTTGETGGEEAAVVNCKPKSATVLYKDKDGVEQEVVLKEVCSVTTNTDTITEDEAGLLDGINIFEPLAKAKQTSSWKIGRAISYVTLGVIAFVGLRMALTKLNHASRPIKRTAKKSSGMDPAMMMMFLNSNNSNNNVQEYI